MITELKIMKGPNMWSADHPKLIVLKLEPQPADHHCVKLLCKELSELLPSLKERLNDVSSDLKEGSERSVMVKIFLLLTLELQEKGFAAKGFYETFERHDILYGICEYNDQEVGTKCAEVAVSIIKNCLSGEWEQSLEDSLKDIESFYVRSKEGPTTNEILKEAQNRNIPVTKVADGRYALLGYGKHRKRLEASICHDTARIAVDIAGNKHLTKQLFTEAQLPVPWGVIVYDEEELDEVIRSVGFPLVVKPHNGHHGKFVTTNIRDRDTLVQSFQLAKQYSSRVIVEKYIAGNDYRFLVVNYKVVAAAQRCAPVIKGDGISTIKELVDKLNQDPLRADGHKGFLTKVELNEDTTKILQREKLTPDSVLEKDEILKLKDTANLSTGGTAIDVTDEIHPSNIAFAERAARVVGLDICGLDIIAQDVKTPFLENGAALIEVNAAPGLRMHIAPSEGKPRKVGKAIIDMMFPDNGDGRIPIVAVTGTNGKTTTTRLMAHVAHTHGHTTGFTTTEGIYINNMPVAIGDCSGPRSSNVVLQDASVEFAVLECARGGILRSGLAFDQCDVGIVTNVAADHLGLKDIHTVEEMARVKQVVPQSVRKDGYAILNASDHLVVRMADDLKCKIGLYSIDPGNEHLVKHCKAGGIGATKDGHGNIIIKRGIKEIIIENVKNIPITLEGKADFMIENVLAVALASYVLKFSLEEIKRALNTFYPNEEQAPGRLNVIDFGKCKVMVDYAHNAHGFKAFSKLMKNINAHKIGIVTAVGDRRDEDIIEVGKTFAGMYDELIIRIDDDTRGREPQEIVDLLRKGINEVNPAVPCCVIPKVKDALVYAIKNATPDSYIIVNAEYAKKTLKIVKDLHEEMKHLFKPVHTEAGH